MSLNGERASLVRPGGQRGYDDNTPEEEEEESYGNIVKAMLFGALDGVLTSFAIVAGATGGGLSGDVVVIIGFSNILADALSMGIGEYLSSKAHNEYIEQERKREEFIMSNDEDRQRGVASVEDAYCQRGMSRADASKMVGILSQYNKLFLDVMMQEELGIPNYKPLDEGESMVEGLVMFFTFAFCGTLPLLPFCLMPVFMPEFSDENLFLVSSLITLFVLFVAGALKSRYIARGCCFSGMETTILGLSCAGLAYEVGAVLAGLLEK